VPTYAFETITAAQAAAITPSDTLIIATGVGRANEVTVLYNPVSGDFPQGSITIAFGGRSVEFGPSIAAVSQAHQIRIFDNPHMFVDERAWVFIGDERGNGISLSSFGVNDAMYGGAGDDQLFGGGGNDLIQGNAGNDTLQGWDDSDVIYGGQGNDRIFTDGGVNFAQGNKGDDFILGGRFFDTLLGGQGDDTIATEAALGFPGDFMNGNLGNDRITGGPTSDIIFGEDGADTLTGGGSDSTADILSGGAGADQFVVVSAAATPALAAVEQIVDWSAEDHLRFEAVGAAGYVEDSAADFAAAITRAAARMANDAADYVAVQVGTDVYVFCDCADTGSAGRLSVVALVGRTLADIDSSNLILG
jgi:Ca2+-binding RTX toxin-like protein